MSTRTADMDDAKDELITHHRGMMDAGARMFEKPAVRVIRPQAAIFCRECEIEGEKVCEAGRIVNGQLVYHTRHNGKTHVVRIDLEYLKRLLAA